MGYPADVRSVMLGSDGVLAGCRSGSILVDMTTSEPSLAVEIADRATAIGAHSVDAPVSGGDIGAREARLSIMIGGEKDVFDRLEPIFNTLAPENGYLYCGPAGAGHFVKMIHNGIEYGMMQAYGEGFALLEASPYRDNFNYQDIARLWNQGSVIRSWLLELLEDAFDDDPGLDKITGYVDDSGEGRWTVQESIDLAVPAPVITQSLQARFRSRQVQPFGVKLLAALRQQFGGHAVKKAK